MSVETRRLALGAILGGATGLFAVACLVLWLRAAVLYVVAFSLGLAIIVPLGAGVLLGIEAARKTGHTAWPWPALVLLAVVSWPAAATLPFGARWLQLRLFVPGSVPVYPGAVRERVSVQLGDNENTSDAVVVVFVVQADSQRLVAFYQDALLQDGWEEGPRPAIEERHEGTPYWFQPQADYKDRSIHILFRAAEPQNRRVEVVYRF